MGMREDYRRIAFRPVRHTDANKFNEMERLVKVQHFLSWTSWRVECESAKCGITWIELFVWYQIHHGTSQQAPLTGQPVSRGQGKGNRSKWRPTTLRDALPQCELRHAFLCCWRRHRWYVLCCWRRRNRAFSNSALSDLDGANGTMCWCQGGRTMWIQRGMSRLGTELIGMEPVGTAKHRILGARLQPITKIRYQN